MTVVSFKSSAMHVPRMARVPRRPAAGNSPLVLFAQEPAAPQRAIAQAEALDRDVADGGDRLGGRVGHEDAVGVANAYEYFTSITLRTKKCRKVIQWSR